MHRVGGKTGLVPSYSLKQTKSSSTQNYYTGLVLFRIILFPKPVKRNRRDSLCSLANTNDSGVLSGSGGEESSLTSASKSNVLL